MCQLKNHVTVFDKNIFFKQRKKKTSYLLLKVIQFHYYGYIDM